MQPMILKLLTTLDEEATGYQDMEKVLTEEEASISFSRRERFDQVQLEKEALVIKLQQFEGKRKPLVDQLSDAYAKGGKPLTVSQLAQFAKPPNDDKLMACADLLRSTIGRVQEKNRRNQLLINQYLDLIKGSLRLLTNLMDDNPVYQKTGTTRPAVGYHSGGGRFICGNV